MRVIDPGHKMVLASLDGGVGEQILTFVKREGAGYPGNVGHYPGTNLQEVYRAAIHRHEYLDAQEHCEENQICIEYLRACIKLLEQRAARRHKRVDPFLAVERLPVCGRCGHIGCLKECAQLKDTEK